MAVKVKTPYWGNFNLPRMCAVCGSPPGIDTKWKISGAKSNWSGKQTTTLKLDVPLCQACYVASQNTRLAKVVTFGGIVMGVMMCLVTAGLMGSDTFGDPFVAIGLGVLGIALFVGGSVWLSNFINTRDFTPEQRKRRGLVKNCAKITSFKAPGLFDKQGWIQFQFQNPAFANEFSRLNGGQLV